MKVIAVASQKGGSGKTTISSHLSVVATQKHKGAVAVVDADPQASLSKWWNRRDDDDFTPQFVQTNVKALESNLARLEEAGFRYVVIDTPGFQSSIIKSVVALSDMVLIPTKPSPLDLNAIGDTIEMVEALDKPMIFVVSIAKKNSRLTADTAVNLSQYGTVAPTIIGDRIDFPTSMIDGRTVMEVFPESRSDKEIRELWAYVERQMKKQKGDK